MSGRVRGRRMDPVVAARVVELLRLGLGPKKIAELAGVSKSYVSLVHYRLGGMYRPVGTTFSARYLDRDERYEIARLQGLGHSIRQIAESMSRSPSTISRELRRNADPRTGGYQPERADTMAWKRQRRPRPSVWVQRPALTERVQQMLDKRLSPEQVAGRLKIDHPDDPAMRVSPETIYRALYVRPRGELARVLKAHLRSGRTTRQPRGRQERRGQIRDLVSITERPEEVEGRQVPGHHEGDLIMGSVVSNTAIGTIVERKSGYLTLLHLPQGYTAERVADAVIAQMSTYPSWFAKTLTWDRGKEMASHARITAETGIQVYFADPYSPHQRGSNENVNGLLREYFPKGSDLSVHTLTDLQAVADELNDRPRKRLGFLTPREVFANLLTEHEGVATTA